MQRGCAAHGCRVGAPWPSSPPQLQPQLSAALCSGQSSAGLPHSSRALLWGRAAHESASLMRGHNRQKHTRAFLTEKHAELLWSAALRAKPGGSEGGAAAGQPRPLLPSSPPPLHPVPSSAPTWSGAPHAEPQCPQPSPPPQRSRTIPGCQQRHGAVPQHNVPLSSGSAPPAPPACPPPHARPWALPRWERSVPSPGLHCSAQLRAAPRGQIAGGHRLFHPHRRSTRWGQKFGSAEGC